MGPYDVEFQVPRRPSRPADRSPDLGDECSRTRCSRTASHRAKLSQGGDPKPFCSGCFRSLNETGKIKPTFGEGLWISLDDLKCSLSGYFYQKFLEGVTGIRARGGVESLSPETRILSAVDEDRSLRIDSQETSSRYYVRRAENGLLEHCQEDVGDHHDFDVLRVVFKSPSIYWRWLREGVWTYVPTEEVPEPTRTCTIGRWSGTEETRCSLCQEDFETESKQTIHIWDDHPEIIDDPRSYRVEVESTSQEQTDFGRWA